MQEQAQLVGSGCDGTVEIAWNAMFRDHVYKWGCNKDLDMEARNLLVLRGPNVVQCYGLCQDNPTVSHGLCQDNPTVSQPRHPGRKGLVMECIPKTIYDVLVDATNIK